MKGIVWDGTNLSVRDDVEVREQQRRLQCVGRIEVGARALGHRQVREVQVVGVVGHGRHHV